MERGIVRYTVGPDALQFNPCQCANQTLVNIIKAILKHSGLPLHSGLMLLVYRFVMRSFSIVSDSWQQVHFN